MNRREWSKLVRTVAAALDGEIEARVLRLTTEPTPELLTNVFEEVSAEFSADVAEAIWKRRV